MKDTKFSMVMFLLMGVLLLGACQPLMEAPATATPEPPDQILFIGDSFTFWNVGIDSHMIGLAASASPPLTIETSSVTRGGFQFVEHWNTAGNPARKAIQKGNWDVVVLQEDPSEPDYDEQTFYEYTRKYDDEIEKIGAQTVLYMPWEWKRNNTQTTTEDIAQAYNNIGAELGVKVAPAGLAWQRALQERPDLNLYDEDLIHPSIHGTYLTICVLYATIFGQSPIGLSYLPVDMLGDDDYDALLFMRKKWQMTEEEAAFLQRIAWETVVDYQKQP